MTIPISPEDLAQARQPGRDGMTRRKWDGPQCEADNKCRDLSHCRHKDTCPMLRWLHEMTLPPEARRVLDGTE